MRRSMLALVLLSVAAPAGALAQQPIQLSPGSLGQLNLGPTGPVRYAVEEVASVRFLGEQAPGPVFAPGDQLELVTEKDGWVRVKKGDKFGWVPVAKLSAERPPEPSAAPAEE